MLIHDQSDRHNMCWNEAVSLTAPRSASTTVRNPLIALDILTHHWDELDKDEAYQTAVAACLAAIRGDGDLEDARLAFKLAAERLSAKH